MSVLFYPHNKKLSVGFSDADSNNVGMSVTLTDKEIAHLHEATTPKPRMIMAALHGPTGKWEMDIIIEDTDIHYVRRVVRGNATWPDNISSSAAASIAKVRYRKDLRVAPKYNPDLLRYTFVYDGEC